MIKTILILAIAHCTLFSVAANDFHHPPGKTAHVLILPDDELNIAPNPATDVVTITTKPNTELYIFNVLGNKVATISAETTETQIPVSNYPNGVYLLKTSTGLSGRFVVKH